MSLTGSLSPSYAGVFLLKAIFLNAVASAERRNTVRLLRGLIVCLAGTSSDVSPSQISRLLTWTNISSSFKPHHHAVRYARLLDSLLRTFSRGQDGVDTSSPQDHINQASMAQAQRASAAANVHLGGSESPWPVSRPASPGIGSTNIPTPMPACIPPSSGLPMSFWGGGPIQHNLGQTQSTAFQAPSGDYRNFNDMSMSGFGASYPTEDMQQGQQSSNHTFGDVGSMNYMQLANQNLGGQPAISPHSDSMVLPMEAYTNLLDDTTLDFWTALTNSQDWGAPTETQMGGTIFPGF